MLSSGNGHADVTVLIEEYKTLLNKIRPISSSTAKGAEKAAIYAKQVAKFLGSILSWEVKPWLNESNITLETLF